MRAEDHKMIAYQALIVAAGAGTRSGLDHNKNLHPLKGRPLLLYSVETFLKDTDCQGVIVVCPETETKAFAEALEGKSILIPGGSTRQQSVRLGLAAVTTKYVFIHDGSRPNLKSEAIMRLKRELRKHDALTLAIPVKDTLKTVSMNMVTGDVPRDTTVMIQTPQAFRSDKIKLAHELAARQEHEFSDDSSLIQHELRETVRIVPGDDDNIKATTKADFTILEALL